jgi:hypothetical protein
MLFLGIKCAPTYCRGFLFCSAGIFAGVFYFQAPIQHDTEPRLRRGGAACCAPTKAGWKPALRNGPRRAPSAPVLRVTDPSAYALGQYCGAPTALQVSSFALKLRRRAANFSRKSAAGCDLFAFLLRVLSVQSLDFSPLGRLEFFVPQNHRERKRRVAQNDQRCLLTS